MKLLKAFVHRNRIADIVRALENAGLRQLSVIDVKGLLRALSNREQAYSIELGERIINEIQLEVFCQDDEVERAVQLIRLFGRTGQQVAGWIYQSAVEQAWPIDGRV
mgnify:CR=1 FL=1